MNCGKLQGKETTEGMRQELHLQLSIMSVPNTPEKECNQAFALDGDERQFP